MDIESILKEKTYKRFLDKPISPNQLSSIIDAGMYIHGAANVISWHFLIVDEEKVKKDLLPYCYKQTWMLQAPIWILVIINTEESNKFFKERAEEFCRQDAMMAVQNIRIRAASFKIGSYFVRSFKEAEIKDGLRIPENQRIEGIMILGHPKGTGQSISRYRIDQVISFNRLGTRKVDSLFPLKKSVSEAWNKVKKSLKKKNAV